MQKIRRDDEVVVLTGRDRGKRGKVARVLDNGKLLVSGINIVKRHTRANPQMGVTGGIVEKEAPIDVSNVGLFNPETGKADRVGIQVREDKTRVRVFKSSGKAVDA